MLATATKRYILPFATSEKSNQPFSNEIEAAVVFSLAEMERKKGGGLIVKQPEEKLSFITKIGYPLWLFPKNETPLIFDGLNNSSYILPYNEIPTVTAFMENLQRSSKTRENYLTFLTDHYSYFQQPVKEKKITLSGLISDSTFKEEFSSYRKEAIEITAQNSSLLSPMIDETKISSIISEVDALHTFYIKDAQLIPECLKSIDKLTSQYVTELNYEADAVKDEADAKIRAQEELVNPQVKKINSQYKQKIISLTKNFDNEIQTLKKQKAKTKKKIETAEMKIKLFDKKARTQAAKKHSYYERKWKEKSGRTKKEISGVKNQLKNIEKNIENLNKQKTLEISKLKSECEAKIKEVRQPLSELEAARDTKMRFYRQEIEKLEKQAKPIIEGLNATAKIRETVASKFEVLGIKRDQQLKAASLFYVPFYIACYQAGLTTRYFIIPPSTAGTAGISSKLKGALGMSRIEELLIPRFKAITSLITAVQTLAQQSTMLEKQIRESGEKTNILGINTGRESIKKGLVYLKHEGWLSGKEYEVLSQKIA